MRSTTLFCLHKSESLFGLSHFPIHLSTRPPTLNIVALLLHFLCYEKEKGEGGGRRGEQEGEGKEEGWGGEEEEAEEEGEGEK